MCVCAIDGKTVRQKLSWSRLFPPLAVGFVYFSSLDGIKKKKRNALL